MIATDHPDAPAMAGPHASQRPWVRLLARSPRKLLALVALTAVVILTAGCGDDDDTADTAAGTSTTAAAEESETVDVVATDYAFQDLPDGIDAGARLSLRNSSRTELHELVALRLPDDERRSAQELLGLPEAELNALFPGEPALVLVAPPGENGFAAVGDGTLSVPGRYLVFCAIPVGADPAEYLRQVQESQGGPPDVAGDPPHFTKGMYGELTVR